MKKGLKRRRSKNCSRQVSRHVPGHAERRKRREKNVKQRNDVKRKNVKMISGDGQEDCGEIRK